MEAASSGPCSVQSGTGIGTENWIWIICISGKCPAEKARRQHPLINKHFSFKQTLNWRDSASSMLHRGALVYLAPHPPKSCGSSRNRLSVSIDPFLFGKEIASKALLYRILILQLAPLWSSGLSHTLALQRCSVWSQRWCQEIRSGKRGDVWAHSPLMPTVITALPSIPRSKTGKYGRDSSPDERNSRTCLEQAFFSWGERLLTGNSDFHHLFEILSCCFLHSLPGFTSVSYSHPN